MAVRASSKQFVMGWPIASPVMLKQCIELDMTQMQALGPTEVSLDDSR